MTMSLFQGVGAVLSAVPDPVPLAAGTVVLLLTTYCWTVKNRERTTNAVNLICALRGKPADEPTAVTTGPRRRRRRTEIGQRPDAQRVQRRR